VLGGVAGLGLCATPASGAPVAAPAAVIEVAPVARERLPDGVVVRGATLERALTFRDKRGTHYLVMSATDSTSGDGVEARRARALYVDDWVIAGTARPRSVLPVRDMVSECVMGAVDARFHDAATAVTDVDHDGIAEVTIGYELACRSDVSPAAYKLLMIEDGAKYILRGKTRVMPDEEVVGGAFEPDPAPARWPAGFLEHARQRWSQTADDLESPPRPAAAPKR